MPIRLDFPQGSKEWAAARMGIPTASQFDKIITPKTMKLSSQADGYMHQLLAEQILGMPLDNATNGFMDRGNILERQAVTFYEMARECDSEPVGLFLRNDRRVGASPDRCVGTDGLVEIKVPAAHTHVGYLLDDNGIGYRTQVQGQLYIAEREWCDTLSWSPDMPPALVRQYRDDEFIAKLEDAIDIFLEELDQAKVKLQKLGLFPGFQQPELRVVA